MQLYKQLREKINYLDESQIAEIYRAYLLAFEAHSGQKRGNGDLFITHPLAVAAILADMHMDHQSIIAALLHDVVEDTTVSKEQLLEAFGGTIAELVDGVTKLTQIEASSKAEAHAENLRKMFLAMSRDIRVILIKLADRIHNMQTIAGIPVYKRKRIARETLDIYAPIANRLGMHDVCVELENLAFVTLYPRRFRVLQESVEKTRGNRKELLQIIEKELQQALKQSAMSHAMLLGREKHLYGIYKKMLRRHSSFSEIMDVYAFRVIVNSVDECYRTLGIVHGLYKPVPGRFKDYIAIPKCNGYQSLHTTLFGPHAVPIEIQIRTREMDRIANTGIADHWLYKQADKTPDMAHIRAQQWVASLLELQQNTGSSLEFIENVKIDLFPDEVYVFTPKGNIMELPRGATAVDFAYAVHTDVGNTCVAARINRQFLPLSSVLMNGQTVSIITAPSAKPNPSWLNFVVTGKAKSGIKVFLKTQKRSESIALGKQLLEKALLDCKIEQSQITTTARQQVLSATKCKNISSLYEEIGLGNRLAVLVARQLAYALADKNATTTTHSNEPLLIQGAEGMAINFALCCCPVPGDKIVGYLHSGHGLDIHTEDCANLLKLRVQTEKCVPVVWAEEVKGDFRVQINVEIKNQRGAIAALGTAISEANSNIDDIRVSERSAEYYLVVLRVMVKNHAHLERVLRHINNIPLVVGVVRKKA